MGFGNRLREGPPLLVDGPTGTELERRGVDTSSPIWSAVAVREQPDLVRAVHTDYAAAGADIHTAVTFRADRAAFQRAGLDEGAWRGTVHAAIRLAREAVAGSDGLVAGSIAPVGDCYAPDEVPGDAVLEAAHGAQARVMADAGVDLVMVETMNSMREAVVATKAVVALDVPVCAAFVVVPGARLLSGDGIADAVAAVRAAGAGAVLVNCSSLPATQDAVAVLGEAGVPWGAYPNGSLADPRMGWTAGKDVTDVTFVDAAQEWLHAGAVMIGSCCGTTPETTRSLRRMMDGTS